MIIPEAGQDREGAERSLGHPLMLQTLASLNWLSPAFLPSKQSSAAIPMDWRDRAAAPGVIWGKLR